MELHRAGAAARPFRCRLPHTVTARTGGSTNGGAGGSSACASRLAHHSAPRHQASERAARRVRPAALPYANNRSSHASPARTCSCRTRARRYGVVKLADFGVGRSLDMLPHGAAKTRLVGTPLYFSPEMCEVPLAPPAGSPPLPSGRTLRRGRAARRGVPAQRGPASGLMCAGQAVRLSQRRVVPRCGRAARVPLCSCRSVTRRSARPGPRA